MNYLTCCINSTAELIGDMVDKSREITLATFLRHVSRADIYSVLDGYGKHFSINRDWHVSYYKSKYDGKSCYYIVHSAIEYVFV